MNVNIADLRARLRPGGRGMVTALYDLQLDGGMRRAGRDWVDVEHPLVALRPSAFTAREGDPVTASALRTLVAQGRGREGLTDRAHGRRVRLRQRPSRRAGA